jgi:hypothetical protein
MTSGDISKIAQYSGRMQAVFDLSELILSKEEHLGLMKIIHDFVSMVPEGYDLRSNNPTD